MLVAFMMTESEVRAIDPTLDLIEIGWMASIPFSLGDPPLVCPMAQEPCSADSVTSSKTSVTRPFALCTRNVPSSLTAIPADS